MQRYPGPNLDGRGTQRSKGHVHKTKISKHCRHRHMSIDCPLVTYRYISPARRRNDDELSFTNRDDVSAALTSSHRHVVTSNSRQYPLCSSLVVTTRLNIKHKIKQT